MPSITATYEDVKKYFVKHTTTDIPEKLKGIWNLDKLGNMSILMSFENAEFDEDRRQMTVKLYEKGNWLFKEENLFTKWLCKALKYSYKFSFNEDYTHAEIDISLGNCKVKLPASMMHWTMDIIDGKMVRTTKIFNSVHHYEATRMEIPTDMYYLRKYDNFYY
jgi:hypothetical protein